MFVKIFFPQSNIFLKYIFNSFIIIKKACNFELI